MAAFLQRDSTRLFQNLLRMFPNPFAFARHPSALRADPYARTVVKSEYKDNVNY